MFRNLSGSRTHGTCRTRDEHDIACFHLADGGQLDIGSQTRQAEHAQVCLDRSDVGVDLLRFIFVQHSVGAPPGEVPDRVAHLGFERARFRNCADRSAGQELVDLKRLDVGLHIVHSPAHVRVDTGEGVFNQDLAIGKLWWLCCLKPEILACRGALREPTAYL